MEIWLKNSKYNIRFPVLPSEYSISSSSNNTSVNVTALSEVTLLGNRQLQQVTFEALFPKVYNSTYCDIPPEHKPADYREIFEKMKQAGVCKLTLTGVKWSKKVTIEQMDSTEDDGTGDVKISFTFKEYVAPKVTKIKSAKKKNGKKKKTKTSNRTTKKTEDRTYKVKNGDTLSRIAQAQTGKSGNWKTIYEDNKGTIGSNPNKIKVGQSLKLRASY